MALARNTLIVTVGSALAMGLGYLFNPLMIARYLGPEGIAIIGIFHSLHHALSFPQRPINILLIREVSKYQASGETNKVGHVLKSFSKKLLLYGIPGLILFLLLSPSISNYLHLDSTTPVTAAIFFTFTGLFLAILKASLQGLLKFTTFSIAVIIEPLFRILAGALLLWMGYRILGIFACYIASYFVVMFFVLWALKGIIGKSASQATTPIKHSMPALPIWIYALFLSVTLSISTILVKHYFSDFEAGIFVATVTLAKIIFMVSAPIATVSYSMMCDQASRNQNFKSLFFTSLSLALACSLGVVGAFAVFSEFIIHVAYGAAFNQAIPLLPFAALAFTPLTPIIFLGQYYLARGSTSFVWGLVAGLMLQVGLILLFHDSLTQVLFSYGLGGIGQFVLALIFHRFGQVKQIESPPDLSSDTFSV